MTTRFTAALAGAMLLAAACSSGTATRNPSPVRNYGPEAGTGGRVATGSRALVAGSYSWNNRLADAQARARQTGKLILVSSTKPGCTLCDQFKNQIVPAVAAEADAISVGYVYDITRPEVRQVDQILRANLKDASLMPLIGFLTPDLRWVHGFWGARTVQQFRGDIATAAQASGRRTADAGGPAGPIGTVQGDDGSRLASVVNEYGEQEWSLPGDVWPAGEDPEPIDAITGTPDADDAADAVSAAMGAAPVVADNTLPPMDDSLPPIDAMPDTPAPTPVAASGNSLPPLGGDMPPLGGDAPTAVAQPTPTPRVATTGPRIPGNQIPPPPSTLPPMAPRPVASRPSTPQPMRTPQPSQPLQPVTQPMPTPTVANDPYAPPAGRVAMGTNTVPALPATHRWSAPAATDNRPAAPVQQQDWGRAALDRAYAQIEGARYDAARETLAQIKQRYPDSSYAREASKGSVALYNAKRIRTASSEAEKERYRARAKRDLGTSMWGRLFS